MKSRRLDFSDKIAVLTGAGSGIGRALALALAARGCHLAIADIREDTLAAVAAELARFPVRVSTHVLDVASREQVASFPAKVLEAHPAVDLLFNNAGVAVGGHFLDTSEADYDWLFEINFHGVVRMTRAFLPGLLQRPDAHIINTASLFSLIAPAGQTHYAASKFAVRAFSDALRHELERSTVGVSAVCPGGIATAIARNARFSTALPEGAVEQQLERSRRLLRMPPERAAQIILSGVAKRNPRIIVGYDAWLGYLLERVLPTGYWPLMRNLTSVD
ncbi:MAG: SDR family NAD(P)-dependent oxidoreductase [Gammaproteobacteria bacterium]